MCILNRALNSLGSPEFRNSKQLQMTRGAFAVCKTKVFWNNTKCGLHSPSASLLVPSHLLPFLTQHFSCLISICTQERHQCHRRQPFVIIKHSLTVFVSRMSMEWSEWKYDVHCPAAKAQHQHHCCFRVRSILPSLCN